MDEGGAHLAGMERSDSGGAGHGGSAAASAELGEPEIAIPPSLTGSALVVSRLDADPPRQGVAASRPLPVPRNGRAVAVPGRLSRALGWPGVRAAVVRRGAVMLGAATRVVRAAATVYALSAVTLGAALAARAALRRRGLLWTGALLLTCAVPFAVRAAGRRVGSPAGTGARPEAGGRRARSSSGSRAAAARDVRRRALTTGVPYGGRLRGLTHDLRARLRSGATVAGAAALALAAAGGWWLGGASHEEAPVPNAVLTVGALRLEIEPTWVQAESVPGLPVAEAQVLAPAPGVAERALFVTGTPTDASLIPGALRAELPAALPEPRGARLGRLPAWTYGPLLDEGRMIEVMVAPTTAGVLAVACSAPTTSWSSWVSCSDGVHAVASHRAKPLVPTVHLAFRQAAVPVLARLDERRAAARRRLSKARSAALASALAQAHRRAADTLAPFAAGGATGETVAALHELARGYDALTQASRGGVARARFIAARRDVTRAERSLAGAFAELR